MSLATNRLLVWHLAAVALGGAAGCGGGSDGTAAAAGGTSSSGTGGAPGAAPTFYEDVAPIVNQHCVSCHSDGGIAPFSLTSYDNAKTVAGAIQKETASRRMPPFHIDNSGACNTYRDARWLTDAEMATIAAWVDGGAREGDPKNAPPLPGKPPGLAKVDATLDMGVTYTPDASLSDDYRCFLIDPGLMSDRYLTGYEVKPGDRRVVHHVVLFTLADAAAQTQAENLDKADSAPGYQCFGGAGVQASLAVGWAPGMPPTKYPDGTGFLIPAGRKLVMQVHYNLSAGALPDRTTMDVSLEPSVAKPAYIYPLVDTNLSLPPGQKNVDVSRDITNQAPTPITIYGAFPHMHKLGRTLSVESDAGGSTTCLANVTDWNFNWQQFYMYNTPLTLQPGGTIHLKCSFDTMGQVDMVTWGEGTKDEMCAAVLYVTQ